MTHEYAPERDPEVQRVLAPTFREPAEVASHPELAQPRFHGMPAPKGPPPPAPGPQPTEAPVPLIEGAIAVFAAPDGSVVLCFRGRGASEDKKTVLPSFLIDLACSQAGRTRDELFAALQEGL